MSLLVWLPLINDNHNQGLLNLTPTDIGKVSYINSGKFGKCLSAGTGTQVVNGISYNSNLVSELGTKFSCSIWVRPLGNHVHYNGAFISSGDWNKKRWTFGVDQYNSKVDVFSYGHNSYINCNVPVNEWTHLCCTSNEGIVKLYKNGEYIGQLTRPANLDSDAINFTVGRETYANGYFSFNGNINDIRIYNHILSTKEIKEISKGLILHYPLDDENIQQMSNSFTNPRFEEGNSGWSVWGPSGHNGTTGLTTDKQYIYRKTQQNAKWIACGAAADSGKYYMLYQSPSFSGGYRSLSCICKREDSGPIRWYDETSGRYRSALWPDWNGEVGDHPANKWDEIISLGDGFYYCKCNGYQTDGSDNFSAFSVNPGYKVYISEAYLENDKMVCSDILYPSTIEYDCSGYNNNGEIHGDITVNPDTPRYSLSTKFIDGRTNYISAPITLGDSKNITINLWIKSTDGSGGYGNYHIPLSISGNNFEISIPTTGKFRNGFVISGTRYVGDYGTVNCLDKNWHMLTATYDGSNIKRYVDGELVNITAISGTLATGDKILVLGNFNSITYGDKNILKSDVRIYTTALSQEDILELYKNGASIDNQNNIYTYEFKEVE